MNPNIKVIDDKIWMVNFSYVGMNFIQELSFRETTASDFITLTDDGKYLLNSADACAMKYLPILKVVTVFPNKLIGTPRGFYSFIKVLAPKMDNLTNKQIDEQINELLNQQKLDNLKVVFDTASTWEKTRRQVHKQYLQRYWISIILNKIFQRKGVKDNG